MEEMISRIKEFSSINKNIRQVIIFDQSIQDVDILKLHNEFGLSREKLEKSMSNYRDVGIILELLKADEEFNTDWDYYINKFLLPGTEPSKFDNVLVNNDKSKLLLLTNRRLLRVDMQRMNSKIEQINRDIEVYNEPVTREAKKQEKLGFMGAIKKIFS